MTILLSVALPASAAHAAPGEPPVVVHLNDGRGCIDSDEGGGFKPNPQAPLGYSWDQIVVSVNPSNCPGP
jgi:hypothetical protein